MAYKYFCNSCGWRFESETPEYDEEGLHNDIPCPHCGAWDIYPDTPEGSADSIRHQTEYENKVAIWGDEQEAE